MELLYVYIAVLNIIYCIFKFIPTNRNKILFLSRQTNMPSVDYRMIAKELKIQKKDIKIVFITKRIEKKSLEFIIKNFTQIFRQMYHLATSKVCIVDGYNIPVSILKHKNSLVVIQIWHSLGGIKKFGYQVMTTKKQKKIAKIMRMHKNYDYIIASSKKVISIFSEAFGYKKEKFEVIGLPRIDYLKNQEKINQEKIYQKYPVFKGKKVILYAPTFRENNHYKVEELISSIDQDEYCLIIKKHDCMKQNTDYEGVYSCFEFTTLQLLSVADYIITDYSAICLESAILNKPTYLFIYDYDEYKISPGLNINLKQEFGSYCFHDAKKLFEAIKKDHYNFEVLNKFKNRYVQNHKGNVTTKISKFILERGAVLDEENTNSQSYKEKLLTSYNFKEN